MALASLSSSSCSWLNLIGPNSNKSVGWRGGGGAKEEPSTSRNSCEIPPRNLRFAANWVVLHSSSRKGESDFHRVYNKLNNTMTQFGSISLYFRLNFYANWIVKTINTKTTANNMALCSFASQLRFLCTFDHIELDGWIMHFPNAKLSCETKKMKCWWQWIT